MIYLKAPALNVAEKLKELGVDVLEVEPNLINGKRIRTVPNNDADIIIFLVADKVFRFHENAKEKVVLDF